MVLLTRGSSTELINGLKPSTKHWWSSGVQWRQRLTSLVIVTKGKSKMVLLRCIMNRRYPMHQPLMTMTMIPIGVVWISPIHFSLSIDQTNLPIKKRKTYLLCNSQSTGIANITRFWFLKGWGMERQCWILVQLPKAKDWTNY